MIVTMDKKGRVVVPKSLRKRFNLEPGCQIEIEASEDHINLRPTDEEYGLVLKDGMLIHHGPTVLTLDLEEFIRAQRNARHAQIAGFSPDDWPDS